MQYEFVRDGLRWGPDTICAVCNRMACHMLALPPSVITPLPDEMVAVPPERRGLCRECGRGLHSLTVLSDEDIERLRCYARANTGPAHAPLFEKAW
jgi:hypothetical protein